MSTHKKITFTSISKQKELILINSMKELKNAFNKKQQIIALDKKSKVIDPGNNGGTKNPNKPPKYFTDFANLVLAFIQEQRKFNAQQEKNWSEQRKFNKKTNRRIEYILDVLKRNNLK